MVSVEFKRSSRPILDKLNGFLTFKFEKNEHEPMKIHARSRFANQNLIFIHQKLKYS